MKLGRRGLPAFIVKGCCIQFVSEAVPWKGRWERKKSDREGKKMQRKGRGRKSAPCRREGKLAGLENAISLHFFQKVTVAGED
jgi:hypothetical protein